MTVNKWWWLAAFGLLAIGCCLLLWWTFRRQQNWPVRGLNLAVTLLALGGWWLWPLPSVQHRFDRHLGVRLNASIPQRSGRRIRPQPR